ncbi:Fc.00g032910.m01.CDS01 [Cosmosporella sp. VM-42]
MRNPMHVKEPHSAKEPSWPVKNVASERGGAMESFRLAEGVQSRLEELERAAEIPYRDQQHDQLSQGEQTQETTYLESADEQPNKDGNAEETRLLPVTAASRQDFTALLSPASDADMLNDHGENQGEPIQRSPAKQNRVSQDSSQCIKPSNFERLMKPIGLAIDRRSSTDASKSTASVLLSDCATPRSPEATSTAPPARARCVCDRLIDAVQWHLPLRREADSLIAIYFARHARMFPVLHRPKFLKQYESLWGSRPDPEKSVQSCVGLCKQKSKGRLFPATVNAVFALAALFSSRHPERNASYAAEFFRLAESIDILDLLNEEVGLEFVQLVLLMAFYLQSTERFSKCWNMAGLALRMAQNMGLHFSIAEAKNRGLLACFPTQLECEMRTRVWHACILLETEVSMTFAQPLNIPIGEVYIKLPEAIDDARLSDEPGKWNVQPRDLPSLMEYYMHAMKLYHILGQVLDRQESMTDTPADPISVVRAVLSLDSKIMDWRDSLPPYLRYDSSLPECDPLKGAGNFERVPDVEVVLDFPDLSKRLHFRFLCVRQLILRPALDLLFERQQNDKPVAVSGPAVKGKLKDSMISNIAAQCVLLATDLVEFLASQIQTQTFVCWWYNIHYLHTSGSTILLGRLCTFEDSTVSPESLSTSWDLCLHHLARYDNMSSIALKSSQLLQESSKRLLRDESHQPGIGERHNHILRVLEPDRAANSFVAEMAQYPTANEGLGNVLGSSDSFQTSGSLDAIDLWNNASFGCSSWAFMAPMSHLETFPLQSEEFCINETLRQ